MEYLEAPWCSLKCGGVSCSSGSQQCPAEHDTATEPAEQSNTTLNPQNRK